MVYKERFGIIQEQGIPDTKKFQRGLVLIRAMMPEVRAVNDVFLAHPRWETNRQDYNQVLHATRIHLRNFPRLAIDYEGDVGAGRLGMLSHQTSRKGVVNTERIVKKTAAKIHKREVLERKLPSADEIGEMIAQGVPIGEVVEFVERSTPRQIPDIRLGLWLKLQKREEESSTD